MSFVIDFVTNMKIEGLLPSTDSEAQLLQVELGDTNSI